MLKLVYLKKYSNINYVKYRFFIQIYNISNNFVIEVNIFYYYKLKMLKSFAFNLTVIIEFVDDFNDFIFNIIVNLSQ